VIPVGTAGARFACNGCGHCCRHLVDLPDPRWPAAFDDLAPFGLYLLPSRGGLAVWSEERRVMLAEAKRRGFGLAFRPSLAALDERLGLVAFAWEAEHDVCPFVGEDNRCGIYDRRPTACRAYPLRHSRGGWTASASCDAAFEPGNGDWPKAYAACMPAAIAARRAPAEAVERLQRLEARGLVAPRHALPREALARALASGRLVDAADLEEARA